MESKAEVRNLPSKKQKVYILFKNFIALAITLIALVPIVYLLGSDESIYPSRPLFSAYANDAYFQSKLAEIQSALNSSIIVNLHSQDNSVREWQNLQQFVRYLGHHLNRQHFTTANRLIVPPEVRLQKKGKNTPNAENQRLVEEAYAIANSGQMNAIRNKLNKVAVSTINRLKIKQREPKNDGIGEVIRSRIVDEVLAPRIWIITIHPDNWQYHSADELRKQITSLGKEGEKDRFVVVSISPADSDWKRMKSIPISINEGVFSSLKNKVKQIVKASFPFEVNTTRVIESVLCHYEASLLQLNNFLQNCNATFSCHNSIKLLSRKGKKGEDELELLNELCSTGHIDEQNAQFRTVLESLGFYGDQGGAEESIKLYFGVANGKKCKGAKQCNYQWLKNEVKVSSANQTKKQQSSKPQLKKPQIPVDWSAKETSSQTLNKQKISSSGKSKNKENTSTKQKKPTKQGQTKKQQQKVAAKQDKVKQSAKNAKTKQADKTKVKSKAAKMKWPKQIEIQKRQCSKIPCQQDPQISQNNVEITDISVQVVEQQKVDAQSGQAVNDQSEEPLKSTEEIQAQQISESVKPVEEGILDSDDSGVLVEVQAVEKSQQQIKNEQEAPAIEETTESSPQSAQNSEQIEAIEQETPLNVQPVNSNAQENETQGVELGEIVEVEKPEIVDESSQSAQQVISEATNPTDTESPPQDQQVIDQQQAKRQPGQQAQKQPEQQASVPAASEPIDAPTPTPEQ